MSCELFFSRAIYIYNIEYKNNIFQDNIDKKIIRYLQSLLVVDN